jgi:RNA polymerase sigma factor (sigma-70 family)
MEDTNTTQQGVEFKPTASETSMLLAHFIETHADSLMGILRSYVRKSGLVSNEAEVREAAIDLLHDVYIEANKTSAHFDPTRSPQSWILGIASNLLMQKKSKMLQRRQHEVTISDLQQKSQASYPASDDVLDQLSLLYGRGFEDEVERREEVRYLFSLLSERDRYVLELSYIQGLDGEALAQKLDCSYTAAQVRLCRARQHLRAAMVKQEGERHE